MSLRLIITNRDGGTMEFKRDERENLHYSTVIDGGDEACSWTTPCTALTNGLPAHRSRVEVRNDTTGKTRWLGWTKKYTPHMKAGKLTKVDFECEGYYHSGQVNPFRHRTIFGPPSVGSSSLDKIVIADIKDAILYALTQRCPEITYDINRIAVTGINLHEDSSNFEGQTAVDVWNYFTGLTYYLFNPVLWQVKSNDFGHPYLDWFTGPTSPAYFDHGDHEEGTLEYDGSEIANQITIGWGNDQQWHHPNENSPVDYSAIKVIQGKYTQAGAELQSFVDVQAFAQGMFTRFNQRRLTGGSLTYKKSLSGIGGVEVLPEEIRAGGIIRVDLPNLTPFTANEAMVQRTDYDEDSCQMTVSLEAIGDRGKNARLLQTIPNKSLTWGIAWGASIPQYDTSQIPMIGQQYPERERTATEAKIGPVVPIAAMTDDRNDWGPGGGTIIPEVLPEQPVNINVILYSTDGVSAIIAEVDKAAQPVQNCVIDKISLRSKRGQPGTIKVSVDIFRPSTNQFLPKVFKAELNSAEFVEVIIPPTQINDGDMLHYNIDEDAVTISRITVGLHGKKRWPAFPQYGWPDWVNR